MPRRSLSLQAAVSVSGLSAAGTTQGTATALVGGVSHIATVASGAGVVLPTSAAGLSCTIFNRGANALLVYPPVSSSIDALAANNSYSMPVNSAITFYCSTGSTWYSSGAGGSGTVTSVGGTGTVNGLTLTGTVTSSGNLTLGGTLSGVANAALTNSSVTIGSTAVSLGSTVTTFTGLSSVTSTTFVGALTGSATQLGGVAAASYAQLASPTFTGTPVLPTTTTIGASGPVVGYRDIPITISNAAKTFALVDAGKGFGKDNATAYTYTIPANSSVAFPTGTAITVFNNNATSNVTIAITTDTLRLGGTTTTGSRTLAPFGVCTLLKVASTTWIASGAGLT
jgi:hypothetical protein